MTSDSTVSFFVFFFFSSRRRHTRLQGDWSSDVCSSDLYPLAISRLTVSLREARRHGFLGTNIGGTTFAFDIEIRIGAGAFLCGEATALTASIGGLRGQPRPRPPYPAVSGLWGCPTLINNVETFANIAPILRKGAEWYSGIGTDKSKGTKVFALTGKIT